MKEKKMMTIILSFFMVRFRKREVSLFLVLAMVITGISFGSLTQEAKADTAEKNITLYFVDNSLEKWVKNNDAVIQLVDNTNGHDYYDMIKIDDTTWSVSVPETAYNITFNRMNSDKSVQWNSWSAGGRNSNNTYYADGAEYGHWDTTDDSEECYFHAGDIVYLDLTDFTSWEYDSALFYINFTEASKAENNDESVYFPIAKKSVYDPQIVSNKVADYVYAYVVTNEDEGSNCLRFWRGNSKYLWNYSAKLTYTDYKKGINSIKITNWDDSSDKCISEYKYGTDGNVTLSDFEADEYDIYIGISTKVTFTVDVEVNEGTFEGALHVYDETHQSICLMNDDGIDGDETADDGIYTGQAEVYSDDVKSVNYYAAVEKLFSNSLELSFYRNITQEEFIAFVKLQSTVAEMTFEAASAYIESSDEVESFSIDSEAKTIRYKSIYGITGLWEDDNNIIDTKGNGEYAISKSEGLDYYTAETIITSAAINSAQSNPNVVVLRPFRNTEFEYDDFKSAGDLAAKALNGRSKIIDDENVTLNVMKGLSSYGAVLIDSHGTKNGKKSYMLIGESLDETKFLWNPVYYAKHIGYSADYLSGRIYCTTKYNRLAIGSKFFDKYYSKNSLNNSFWYLGTCYSAYKDGIPNTLTKKGAGAVVGFTDTVSVTYCNECLFETTINSMILSSDTLYNSVQCAKDFYGETDSGNVLCYYKSYGDSDYKLVESINIPKGTLSGKICKANNRSTPVSNAKVRIYRDNSYLRYVTSDASGNFSTELEAGNYMVNVSAEGYISFNAYITVTKDKDTYLETFLLIEGSEDSTGTATGTIYDSITGRGIEEVTITVRSGWNNMSVGEVLAECTSNSSGVYTVTLPLGNYTVCASKDGYVANHTNIIVQEGITSSQNCTLVSVMDNDTYRIVLSWGVNPRDLDSHMTGTLSDNSTFHVSYSNKKCNDGDTEVCILDVDDVTSYGPETITLKPITDKPYYYFVHRFAGSGTIASSEAQVKVYKGSELIKTYNVPSNLGTADYWNVFALVDGEIVVGNTISSSPDTTYANQE